MPTQKTFLVWENSEILSKKAGFAWADRLEAVWQWTDLFDFEAGRARGT
jgi:hypothetical protein